MSDSEESRTPPAVKLVFQRWDPDSPQTPVSEAIERAIAEGYTLDTAKCYRYGFSQPEKIKTIDLPYQQPAAPPPPTGTP